MIERLFDGHDLTPRESKEPRLTALEKEAMYLLEDLNLFLTKKPKALEFMEMMGRIRDLRYKLLNKKFGCPTGKHSVNCNCERED